MVATKKHKEVAKLLLKNRNPDGSADFGTGNWRWLSEEANKGHCLPHGEANKKEANKFLFAAIMQRQMDAVKLWNNAEKLLESKQFLGNPKDLWQAILLVPSGKWNKWWDKEAFHRYKIRMCNNQRKNAQIMIKKYNGDAREVWRNQPDVGSILKRLRGLHGVGNAMAKMILIALRDTDQIDIAGPLDVKADIHVRRVLGRVFYGDLVAVNEAENIARIIHPEDPSKLDRSIFALGKNICHKETPNCPNCYLRANCVYARNR